MPKSRKSAKPRRSPREQTITGPRFVSYLRVSTARQGASGLGIEAQRAAVAQHIRAGGPRASLLAEYVEQESGRRSRRSDRPRLWQAIDHARLSGAILIIAKLDRLSRNAAFLLTLRDSGARFVAADMPGANDLSIGVLAVVAEHEAKMISERTKAALAEARKRVAKHGQNGHPTVKRLGNPNGAASLRRAKHGNRAAVSVVKANADERAESFRDIIQHIRERDGIASARGIAAALNDRCFQSPRGGAWTAQSVIRLINRLEARAA